MYKYLVTSRALPCVPQGQLPSLGRQGLGQRAGTGSRIGFCYGFDSSKGQRRSCGSLGKEGGRAEWLTRMASRAFQQESSMAFLRPQ